MFPECEWKGESRRGGQGDHRDLTVLPLVATISVRHETSTGRSVIERRDSHCRSLSRVAIPLICASGITLMNPA